MQPFQMTHLMYFNSAVQTSGKGYYMSVGIHKINVAALHYG